MNHLRKLQQIIMLRNFEYSATLKLLNLLASNKLPAPLKMNRPGQMLNTLPRSNLVAVH